MGNKRNHSIKMASSNFFFLLAFLGICLMAHVVQSAPAMDSEAEPEAFRSRGYCSSSWVCKGFLCSSAIAKLTPTNAVRQTVQMPTTIRHPASVTAKIKTEILPNTLQGSVGLQDV